MSSPVSCVIAHGVRDPYAGVFALAAVVVAFLSHPLIFSAPHLRLFTASLRLRFPNTVLSLIRSFARHPALLSRESRGDDPSPEEFHGTSTIRRSGGGGCCAGARTPAHAVTELQWWHAMTGGNNDIVNKLAEEFNASQSTGRSDLQGRLSRHHECRHRRVPRRHRAAHHSGVPRSAPPR